MYSKDFIEKLGIYLDNFDDVIYVSNQIKEVIEQLYPKNKKNLKVISNFINTKQIIFKSKKSIEYDKSRKTIVCSGRLVTVKRFDIIIEAINILHKNNNKVRLIIMGEGPERENLLLKIKKLKLEDSIDLIGFQDNPYPYIYNADVFVLCSDYEGFSLVLAESLVLGKACISTDCTGAVEIFDNGQYGIIVEKGNPKQLANELNKVLMDNNVKRYWESRAKERSNMFNEEEFMKQLLNLIT